ncbi:Peroxidase 3 [Acorus calamus]|uniref:Peroxidase n=1 Tax=Acorus calamus TaxID=4465 RepID=A0AAV9FGT7_ACOCL|nr:Peroxidase 3 [Acorus calamus]
MEKATTYIGLIFLGLLFGSAHADLKLGFYAHSCPKAEQIVSEFVMKHIKNAPTLAAPLLRMHFHDCFVRGCDGSVLINSTSNNQAEKSAIPNQSLRGFGFIDNLKALLEAACPGVVSCADTSHWPREMQLSPLEDHSGMYRRGGETGPFERDRGPKQHPSAGFQLHTTSNVLRQQGTQPHRSSTTFRRPHHWHHALRPPHFQQPPLQLHRQRRPRPRVGQRVRGEPKEEQVQDPERQHDNCRDGPGELPDVRSRVLQTGAEAERDLRVGLLPHQEFIHQCLHFEARRRSGIGVL